MTAADKLIDIALREVGYLEKKSDRDLDSKTDNAGSGNYTKYNRDLKAWTGVGYLNQQWCQAFVDWCFIEAFGKDDARKLIHAFTNYTPTGSNAFKRAGQYVRRGKGRPRRGDMIYFYSKSKGRIGHVGIVYKVSGSVVYTVEGNTSGASSLVTNGGGVRKKSYNLGTTYIDGYGTVDYSVLERDHRRLGDRDLRRGDTGQDVQQLQQALIRLGWEFPRYGADGDFGRETEANVRDFQRNCGLEPTGVFDRASFEALLQRVAREVEITGEHVNVRSGPGTECPILGVVHRGERLPFAGTAYGNGWLAVTYHGQTAAVSGKYARLQA